MIISNRRIRLVEIYHTTSLGTRQSALIIADEMRASDADHIILDFEGITYASLSFLDQLNSEVSTKIDKKIELVNLNADLRKMMEIVRKRASFTGGRRSIRREVKIGSI